jgi:DNA polymerase-3 subunit beta
VATDEGRLRLSSTNLEIGINLWIPAMAEHEGSTTMPARLLSEFVNSLPNGRVDLELTEGHVTTVRSARFSANIRGIDPDEFPLIPTVSEQPAARITASTLKEMIEQVAFSAAEDESRMTLTGVLTTFSGTVLTMAATDGYRLSVRSAEMAEPAQGDFSVIVPARTLIELAKIVPDGDTMVDVAITPNRNQILFHTENLDLVSRLIEGQYINYRQVIPQKAATRATMVTGDLLKATRIAGFFARDGGKIMKLVVDPQGANGNGGGTVTISALAADVGDNESVIDAHVEGPGLQVLFNVDYITEVLGVLSAGEVSLELNGPSSAGVIKPVGATDYMHLMMPMSSPRG